MGDQRNAERAGRRRERAFLGQAFRADLLNLTDVFPELDMVPGRLTAAASGPGLALRQEGSCLLLACMYETAWGFL